MRICSVAGCGHKRVGRGLCEKHYRRALRSGTLPPLVKKVAPTVKFLMAAAHFSDPDQCLDWPFALRQRGGRDEYGVIWVSGRNHCVTRVLVGAILGRELLPSEIVLHSCHRPPCVNPHHLRIGTNKENTQDAVDAGRIAHGVRHGCARLTEAQVIEIRAAYAAGGVTQKALAKRFGVTDGAISHIVHRRQWRHLP